MLKTRKKWISILLTLAMLVGLMVPFAGTASAATTYEAITNVTSFNPSSVSAANQAGATVQAKFDPYVPGTSDVLIEVHDSNNKVLEFTSAPTVTVIQNDTVVSGVYVATVTPIGSKTANGYYQTYKISVPEQAYAKPVSVQIKANFYGKDAANGDVSLVFFKGSNQFSSGSVVIARAKSGNVTASAIDIPTFSDQGGSVTIRFEESLKEAIEADPASIKIKLPNGFTWDKATVSASSLTDNGPKFGTITFEDSDRTAVIPVTTKSSSSAIVQVTGTVKVDSTLAKIGNVDVTFSGKTAVSPSTLTVANYGEYKASVECNDVKAITAGKLDQELGKILIKEDMPGTLVANRTITFTLPEKAKWTENPYYSSGDSDAPNFALKDSTMQSVGSDGRQVKAIIDKQSTGTEATTIVFKGGKITVAPDFVGPLEIEVGGTAGVSGTVKVAEVKPSVEVKPSGTPEVIIGRQGQLVADVDITETLKENMAATVTEGAYHYDGYVALITPSGVTFAEKPSFSVKEGDVVIGDVVLDANDSIAAVRIKATSTTPSTIKVSNIKLNVDRSVAEGDLQLKIGGNALIENQGYFPGNDYVVKATVAKVITPAPVETKATAVFKIGDYKYTISGVEKTLDAAPFIQDNRTYLPVRYVAEALGVQNIAWDDQTKTATLIRNGIVVQVKEGSDIMTINGASIKMDVPTLNVAPGRLMLPFRWIAQYAFGANVQWDEATQTVTLSL